MGGRRVSLVIEYLRFMGSIAVGFMPWMIGRWIAHAVALVQFRTAGECQHCRANVTWRLLGLRPAHCPACGRVDPCPDDGMPALP